MNPCFSLRGPLCELCAFVVALHNNPGFDLGYGAADRSCWGGEGRTMRVCVDHQHQVFQVVDLETLEEVLARRDPRGGAVFWIQTDDKEYPVFGIRASGDVADVHYLPGDDHPGFRCIGSGGLSVEGMTTLVFEGCQPWSGEETMTMFIVPFETALSTAKEFFSSARMPESVEWFEL